MKRIDWINGKVPINRTNLNGMQDNIEESCVVVSAIEPTSNESVWIKKGKNLVNGLTLGDVGNCSVGNVPTYDAQIKNRVTLKSLFLEIIGGATISASISSGYQFAIYVCDKNRQILIAPTEYTYPSITTELSSDSKYLCVKIKKDDGTDITNADLESIQFQIEYGEEPTEYEQFIEEKILIKNSAGVFEEYSDVVVSPVKPAQGKVWIKKGKNLFNRKNAISGYIGSNGAFVTAINNEVTSDYIEIEKGKDYTLSIENWEGEQMWVGISLYDENKTFIERWDKYDASVTVPSTATQNAKYIRTSNRYNSNNIQIMLEQNSTATTYEDYIEKEIYVKNENGVFERFYSENELSQQNYSATEQKIGTWINGKPLYQKILQVSAPTTNSNGTFVSQNYNVADDIEHCFITWAYVTENTQNQPLPYTTNTGYTLKAFITTGQVLYVSSSSTGFNGKPITLCVQYTKTTD